MTYLDVITWVPTAYAICFATVFGIVFTITRILPCSVRVFKCLYLLALRNLGYRYVVGRHRVVGPWTAASMLFHCIYVSANLACLLYPPVSTSKVSSRASILSLINLAPVFLSTHLSFLAAVFGVSLKTYQRIHRSTGIMATSLLLVHGLISMIHDSFSFDNWCNRYGSMVLCLISCSPNCFCLDMKISCQLITDGGIDRAWYHSCLC